MICKCGGPVTEITTTDDRAPVFMCQDCGHQGPAREFPDMEEQAPTLGVVARARLRLAELIAPKI